MNAVIVKNLSRNFLVYKRKSTLLSAFSSLFHREMVEVKAVKSVSFSIKQGELIGFIGPNGAGKTTTLKCLSGLLFPSSGGVSVLGFTPSKRERKFLKQISLVMGQKNQLWWDLPALDTFRLNKEMYDLSDSQYKKTLDELVDLLDVGSLLSIPVRQLSLGQRMKMELIAALLHQPKMLFLDEPTIGLDVVMQKKIRDFIRDYNKKYNSTIILTSHYMADVKELCKRVIIIDQGKIVYDGKLEKLRKKYSQTKIITVETKKEIPYRVLQIFGEVQLIDKSRVRIHVLKKDINKVASTILSKYNVEDLLIEEPEIEDVIRQVFHTSHTHAKI